MLRHTAPLQFACLMRRICWLGSALTRRIQNPLSFRKPTVPRIVHEMKGQVENSLHRADPVCFVI